MVNIDILVISLSHLSKLVNEKYFHLSKNMVIVVSVLSYLYLVGMEKRIYLHKNILKPQFIMLCLHGPSY